MIGKMTYEQMLAVSNELKNEALIIEKLIQDNDNQSLNDFVATVEGYSKFLENTVEINRDADNALSELTGKK